MEEEELSINGISKDNNNIEYFDLNEIMNARNELNIFGYDFNNKNILKSILLNNKNEVIEDLENINNFMEIESDSEENTSMNKNKNKKKKRLDIGLGQSLISH